ncbi:hypothetical protein BDQ17DRAFT_417763 [Cyathus striatus]|nr:hypothetical protein BDQ17DRAFT_417763 [Cyathus striatus]
MSLTFDPSVVSQTYLDDDVANRYLEQGYGSFSALVFIVCEHVAISSYEFVYIWRRPMTVVKIIYVFSRYFGLLFQIANPVIYKFHLSYLPVSSTACYNWYLAQSTSFLLICIAMNAVCLLTVYAMYKQSRRAGYILTALFFAEALISIILLLRILASMEFDVICYGTVVSIEHTMLGIILSINVVITVLTAMSKHSTRTTSSDFLIIRTVSRDIGWVFAILLVFFAYTVPYGMAKQVMRPYIVFSWAVTVFSTLTCRIIINLQQMDLGTSEESSTPLQYVGATPESITLPSFFTASNDVGANL